jgi:hypothetical protein
VILIAGYQIDASLSEEHTFESEVSEYPVETGGDVTDNIRPKPIIVKINGIVSDTPIGTIADVRGRQGDNGALDFTPSNDAYAKLKDIRDKREPVSIVTTLQTFDSMVMTNLEVPRDAKTGKALRFTATFQQVTLVTNLRTTIRVATPSGAKKTDLGTKSTKNVDTARVRVVDAHGTAVEGVHWDEKNKKYVDKDGFSVFDESENYKLDQSSGRYVDSDGNPVTQNGTRNPGTVGNRGAPWWSNWGYLPDN